MDKDNRADQVTWIFTNGEWLESIFGSKTVNRALNRITKEELSERFKREVEQRAQQAQIPRVKIEQKKSA